MQYINPIEILGLSTVLDTTSIDIEIVKKAKRKLFADIDLSDDGLFEYYGLQLTKGDCEKVIDELANNDLKEFYFYLVTNKKLNSFLVNGNNEVFTNLKQDSIFKLPEFVKFISPYFALKFDKAFLNAFKSEDIEVTKSILKTKFLISQSDINMAYKGVSNSIQNKISEIDEITKDIKNVESIYDEGDIEDVIENVKEKFPTQTINLLPQYFQSQILKIAKSINYLQLSIWDAFDNAQVPKDLLEHLLTLNIGGLDKPTFENNYKIVKKKNDERIEQTKNAPLLKKWASVLLQLRKFIKEVEEKSLSSNFAFEQTKNLFSISELNSLPDFADDIRAQIGYSIRSLSISIWNKHNDIWSAIKTIDIALEIQISDQYKIKLLKDKAELQELRDDNKDTLVCWFCNKYQPNVSNHITKTIYLEKSRSRGVIQNQVSYAQETVYIPRCKNCSTTHSSEDTTKIHMAAFISCLLTGIIIGLIIGTFIFCTIFGIVIGFIANFLITELVDNPRIIAKGVKLDNDSSLKQHPLLRLKINAGWSFSKPSAR